MTMHQICFFGSSAAQSEKTLRIRLDHIGFFCIGMVLAILEVSLRKTMDLPIVEGVLAIWGIAEFVGRRLHLETARPTGLYVLAGCAALFGAWIVIADSLFL